MHRKLRANLKPHIVLLILLAGNFLLLAQQRRPSSAAASGDLAAHPAPKNFQTNRIKAASVDFANLPLAFELNTGQVDSRVKFFSKQGGADLYLMSTQAVIGLRSSATLRMKLRGANANAIVKGAESLPGHQNYLLGSNPEKWQTNVPTFRKVIYQEIYPGTNLIYYGNSNQLEYDFELAPGANPNAIRLLFAKSVRVRLSDDGSLVLAAS